MRNILRIDLTKKQSAFEPLPESLKNLGGRGLISSILADEVDPKTDPLGAGNKLVFAPGLLAGTVVLNSGRCSVGAKSPLTQGIMEANSGGQAARTMAKNGIAAIVIEGAADTLTLLKISKDKVIFEDAAALKGLGNYAVIDALKEESCAIVSIGQAGEQQFTAAGIMMTTKDLHPRMAARGGLGAVMGSKNLKAFVLDDTADQPIVPANVKKEFTAAAARLSKGVLAHPLMQGLEHMGTPVLVNMINEMGALTTRTFAKGRIENAEALSAELMATLAQTRPNFKMSHKCMDGCMVSCSNIFTDDAGEVVVGGLEYETLALVGSNCMIDDIDIVAQINRECNDVGVDTMEIGGALALFMEAGKLAWGDGKTALELVRQIAGGTEAGIMLGKGGLYTGQSLKVARIPHVKGRILAGYDPRVLKGTGVTYATSPTGADHTAGNALPSPANPDYNPMASTGQAPVSQFLQNHNATVDTLGICLFPMLALLDIPDLKAPLIECVSLLTGTTLSDNYIDETGDRILAIERKFNAGAGLTTADDRLPSFFSTEVLESTGTVFDVPETEIDSINTL
ncbi:MAG TPA: aldehyde ferredoxin oxidoreductase C-terminal domain-containing protein [Desulfotignum sp.]|nr:aldehyde ferredoxin oxidoreductase C-terminal domain-containing protein [Desulfotignum sp.]